MLFRLRFADGIAGVVDQGAELPAGTYARDTVAHDRGRALVWNDPGSEDVDFDAEMLHGLLKAGREAAEWLICAKHYAHHRPQQPLGLEPEYAIGLSLGFNPRYDSLFCFIYSGSGP